MVRSLKDAMLRMTLNIHNCCEQCYDGASNMCGIMGGTSTQTCAEEPMAI